MGRRWMAGIAIVCSVARGDGMPVCPEPEAVHQAPMTGPVRPGYFQVVEVRRDRAMECWLDEGRKALGAGRLVEADRAYRKAWHDGKNEITALLGLAAVAVRQGQLDEARRRYLQVLDLDADNATALAGLSIVTGDDPQLLATLERIASERPNQAEVHFALGNLHARQGDWPKAQSAYFEAYRLDKDNPTHAYNLAVSLDQLGKRVLARRFYRRALDMAQLRSAGFDPQVVETRLNQLSGGDR